MGNRRLFHTCCIHGQKGEAAPPPEEIAPFPEPADMIPNEGGESDGPVRVSHLEMEQMHMKNCTTTR